MRDFFYLSLEAISRQIDATISNTSIKRLVDYNYGQDPGFRNQVSERAADLKNRSALPGPSLATRHSSLPYPRLVTSNIVVINPLELLEVAKDVGKFDVDLLQPDDDTEDWIRKKCGLPLKSKTRRVRWAPIQTRIEGEEETVPVEPGSK